jgi:hypothetical protein
MYNEILKVIRSGKPLTDKQLKFIFTELNKDQYFELIEIYNNYIAFVQFGGLDSD